MEGEIGEKRGRMNGGGDKGKRRRMNGGGDRGKKRKYEWRGR